MESHLVRSRGNFYLGESFYVKKNTEDNFSIIHKFLNRNIWK